MENILDTWEVVFSQNGRPLINGNNIVLQNKIGKIQNIGIVIRLYKGINFQTNQLVI